MTWHLYNEKALKSKLRPNFKNPDTIMWHLLYNSSRPQTIRKCNDIPCTGRTYAKERHRQCNIMRKYYCTEIPVLSESCMIM